MERAGKRRGLPPDGSELVAGAAGDPALSRGEAVRGALIDASAAAAAGGLGGEVGGDARRRSCCAAAPALLGGDGAASIPGDTPPRGEKTAPPCDCCEAHDGRHV